MAEPGRPLQLGAELVDSSAEEAVKRALIGVAVPGRVPEQERPGGARRLGLLQVDLPTQPDTNPVEVSCLQEGPAHGERKVAVLDALLLSIEQATSLAEPAGRNGEVEAASVPHRQHDGGQGGAPPVTRAHVGGVRPLPGSKRILKMVGPHRRLGKSIEILGREPSGLIGDREQLGRLLPGPPGKRLPPGIEVGR